KRRAGGGGGQRRAARLSVVRAAVAVGGGEGGGGGGVGIPGAAVVRDTALRHLTTAICKYTFIYKWAARRAFAATSSWRPRAASSPPRGSPPPPSPRSPASSTSPPPPFSATPRRSRSFSLRPCKAARSCRCPPP